jgi:hypothetical protein
MERYLPRLQQGEPQNLYSVHYGFIRNNRHMNRDGVDIGDVPSPSAVACRCHPTGLVQPQIIQPYHPQLKSDTRGYSTLRKYLG